MWGAGTPRTLRAYWALEELGLGYASRAILPRTPAMQDASFRAVSLRGKIPILEDGTQVVGESGAIVVYLADRYREGEHTLSPAPDAPERGLFQDLCFFVLTELDATALYVIRRHDGLPEVYGAAPVATRAAAEYFLRQVGEMERRLSDDRPWLMGEGFSGADILLVSCIDWASALGMSLPELLVSYRHRAAERAAYSRAMQVNFAPLAALGARRA